jgi:hypothetical protein
MEDCVQLHAPAALPLVKSFRCQVSKRLSVPHILFGRFGEEKNLLRLPGFEPWVVHPVT